MIPGAIRCVKDGCCERAVYPPGLCANHAGHPGAIRNVSREPVSIRQWARIGPRDGNPPFAAANSRITVLKGRPAKRTVALVSGGLRTFSVSDVCNGSLPAGAIMGGAQPTILSSPHIGRAGALC